MKLTKPCKNCRETITKAQNCSLKNWRSRKKYCSHKCRADYLSRSPRWLRRQHLSHLGAKQSSETLKKRSESQRGEKGSNWRGDNVGYIGIHQWLRKNFGKPSKCENTSCVYPRQGSKRWLEKPCWHEWALLKGKTYERKRENFIQLCVACHRKYDSNSETILD